MKRKIVMGLLAICLAGCQPDAPEPTEPQQDDPELIKHQQDVRELTGHWQANVDKCVLLCGFTISEDPQTKVFQFRFDDEGHSELARMARGEFQHVQGNNWVLVIKDGGEIAFRLEGNKLVAEEDTEFEKLPNVALLNN